MSILNEKSIKTLAKLLLALIELNISVYDFFDGAIYEQQVKTKTKQNQVEIIDAKDFFGLLQARGVRKNNTPIENLQKFLQIDPSYSHLLMIKKLVKALDEMTKNEELMGQLLAPEGEEDEEGADGNLVRPDGLGISTGEGQLQQMVDGEEYELEEQERLGTIGEDKDENFDTNKENSRGTLQNIRRKQGSNLKESSSKKQQEESYAQEQEDEDYENDVYEEQEQNEEEDYEF